jgi:predicted amidophosphoribosyltransferase
MHTLKGQNETNFLQKLQAWAWLKWYSGCLASTRPLVQTPVPQKKKKKKTRGEEERGGGER